ncbi:U1 small nuclear ribonucleoprotein 70 kDa [Microplitis mediator]|uniref:U1 small nuclear ribonucleoprotein 70 kDa n=1 Tax=Microplitis demolitor TaxID=69319 RepID=UPI0004CDB1F8|nr:U1 small nuclear ribonucleoprotein 70 kDa [Microplitis demolitor]XP_057318222.1 U1 small nuclear ribonucleoprotein 70 kDa [Microplitis mediator]
MTQFLPPNLLALFAPRDPIPYLPPVSKLPHEKKNGGYLGVGSFLKYFEDPKDTPPPLRVETREERLERRRRERAEQVAYKLEQEIAVWDPAAIPNVTADPFKTLFVARINYDTSESKLRREFEVYGPVKKIVVIHNTVNGKPRGYAFIEYEHERDMHSAYKHADGKKIDGRRVLVDVERARTVKGWLPRRLGGGLGGTRRGGPDVNIKHSGREDNERERERYRLEREREATGRGLDRERDRDRIDRERRRSRERKRRSRSRSRERKRRRSRERGAEPEVEEIQREERSRDRRERDRDRSDRDRDRKRRRSRSNDRTDRDRDRERKRDKRDRERRDRKDRERVPDEDTKEIRVKEEPLDDYPDYNNSYTSTTPYFAQVKYEDDNEVEEKYRIPENRNDQPSYNYDSVPEYH